MRMFFKALGLALLHLLCLFATVGATYFAFVWLEPVTGSIIALVVAAIVFIVLICIYARVFWKLRPLDLFGLMFSMLDS